MLLAEKLHPQYLKTNNGKSPFVVLPTNEYEDLIDDLKDLAVIAERKNEETFSHSKLIQGLKTDGYL